MNLDAILKEWQTDSVIKDNLAETSVDSAKLHAKYLKILFETKLLLKKEEMKQKQLLKAKWLYYEGKMTKEEMDSRGWSYDPYDGHNIKMKAHKEYYYGSDLDIGASEEMVDYYKAMVDALKEIVEAIKWRHQTIRNIIQWKIFESGG